MNDDQLWEIERGFWVHGREHYRRFWSKDAVAGFPRPAGIMTGADFVDSLPDEGGYEEVSMSEKVLARPHEGVAVLAYRAHGRSRDRDYRCICTSTYLDHEGWRMIQHSQVPAGGDA